MSNPISDAWFHRVKSATRDLVTICGGVVRAGEIANVSKSEMSRFQSSSDPGIIGIAQALALEADCGKPLITGVLADLNGRRLTEPEAEGRSSANAFSRILDAATALNETVRAAGEAQADGVWTPAEGERVDRFLGKVADFVDDARREVASIRSGAGLRAVPGGRGAA